MLAELMIHSTPYALGSSMAAAAGAGATPPVVGLKRKLDEDPLVDQIWVVENKKKQLWIINNNNNYGNEG